MFDLEKAIATWRHQFIYNRLFDNRDVDELERHVRDHVEFLIGRGSSEEDAFRHTINELGEYSETESEYRKVFWSKLRYQNHITEEVFWNLSMLKNYLKVTVRTLARNRTYSIINIAGLAVGIACCLLTFLIVRHEMSYDRYHERADDIYRLNVNWQSPEFVFENAITSAPFAPAFEEAFPAIEAITRITASGEKVLLRNGDTRLYTDNNRFVYADPSIFEVFSLGFEGADSATALAAPYTMVLTRSMAKNIFGDQSPMGQTVRVDDTYDYEVTGLIDDVPDNSHVHFDILVSMASFNEGSGPTNQIWSFNPYFTYLLLPQHYDHTLLEAQFPDFLERNIEEDNREWMSILLQPLTEIHLNPKGNDLEPSGSETYVTILWIIALAILTIACFNFVNLATARSMTRSKEISMRKVVGAARSQIRVQFLTESVLISFLATLLGSMLTIAVLPVVESMLNITITPGEIGGGLGVVILSLVSGAMILGIVAGLYPAFIMARMSPLRLVKGPGKSSSRGSPKSLRSVLVVFQFAVSVILIIATIVVFRQINYMTSTDLGLNTSQVIAIPLRSESTRASAPVMKDELVRLGSVQHAAVALRKPGTGAWGSEYSLPEWDDNDRVSMKFNSIGYDYLETLEIDLLSGRFFSEDFPSDVESGVLINLEAVTEFGWQTTDEAIGKEIKRGGLFRTVLGVTNNYHFQSMSVEMQPMVMYLAPETSNYLLIKTADGRTQEAVSELVPIWNRLNPEWPISYSFLDRDYEALYEKEARFSQMFSALTLLALFIACMGLFGLASFSLESRTNELGIRKALGATGGNIALLLTTDIARLILIANFIAWPIAYYGANQWLQNYPFRTDIEYWIFGMAGIGAVLIALASTGWQAWQASRTNPVDSLRRE